jgi:hypothetical protein
MQPALHRPGPVVEVTWSDIATSIGWQEREELERDKTADFTTCLSVGYLVANEPDRVIIVQSISTDQAHAERTVIPKAVVRSIRKIAARRPRK